MENKQYIDRLHLYGVGLRFLRKYGKALDNAFFLSIDSTKWTRAVNNKLKLKSGVCCRKHNRNEYFLEYIKVIENEIGIRVDY